MPNTIEPVPNVPVSPLLTGRGGKQSSFGVLPPANRKTDANGEVEFQWLPPAKDYDFRPAVFGNKEFNWNQSKSIKSNSPSDDLKRVYVTRNSKKKTVNGKLLGGKGDLKNIRVSGRGYKGDTSDYFESFTNSKGEFEANLVPGMKYSIGITNEFWASEVKAFLAVEGTDVHAQYLPSHTHHRHVDCGQ